MPPTAVLELRRAVLREGRADLDPALPEDDMPGAFTLAAVAPDGEVVGTATFSPTTTDRRPGRAAWRLRGMAVADSVQGLGVGSRLLDEGVARVRAEGAEVLWADGRDTAIGFYERRGWAVEGEGYVSGAIALPHHFVVLDLQ